MRDTADESPNPPDPGGRSRARRRTSVTLLVAFGVLCFGVALASWLWPDRPDRIVLILIDTLRRDHVSAYGGEVETPSIDALAQRGRRFDHAVASFHQTTMSMASIFTGRTPSIESGDPRKPLPWNGKTWCGMSRFAAGPEDSCIPAALPTLAELLRDAGYWTIGISSNALLFEPAGYARGFDDWIEVGARGKGMKTLATQQAAVARSAPHVQAALSAALLRRPSDRFFLYVHWMDVHDYRLVGEGYGRSVKRQDAAIGALMEALEKGGYLRDATVILTSDHGELLRGKHPVTSYRKRGHFGNPTFEPVLNVPLIVSPAPDVPADRVLRGQDLFGLILDIAGVTAPPRDAPALRPGELLLSENRWTTYRDDGFKSVWKRDETEYRLFDLGGDPEETSDVGAQHPERAEAHRGRIRELQSQLSNREAMSAELNPEDRERLRVLGYIE